MYRRGAANTTQLIFLIAVMISTMLGVAVLLNPADETKQIVITGSQTAKLAGNNIHVTSVIGADGTNELENLTLTLVLNAGSQPVRFDSLLIQFTTDDTVTNYRYGNVFGLDPGGETGTYSLIYIDSGTTHAAGALVHGDLVELYLQLPRPALDGEKIQLRILPETGLPSTVSFTVPDITTKRRIPLFP